MIKKFFIFPLLALLAILPQIHGQVILDTGFGSNSGYELIPLGDDGKTDSLSLTVNDTASGRMLVAFVHARWTSGGVTVNDLSYGGDDFTFISAATQSIDGGDIYTGAYYLANPTGGSNTLSVDISGVNRGVGVSVFSLVDTDGSAPTAFGSEVVADSPSTVSGTTSQDDAFLLSAVTVRDPANEITVNGTGQTLAFNEFEPTNSTSEYRITTAAGYETISTAGSDSISWQWSGDGTDPQTSGAHLVLEVHSIPEPSAAMLLLGGLSVMLLIRRRR